MSKIHLKWKHLFIAVILISLLLGIFLGFFCIKQSITPYQFIRSFWLAKTAKASPAKVADSYLIAWENLQPEKMYNSLVEKEKEITPREKYIEDFEEFPLRPIEHKVRKTRSFGNKATVTILVTWPSLDETPLEKEEIIILFLEDNKWQISEKDSFK